MEMKKLASKNYLAWFFAAVLAFAFFGLAGCSSDDSSAESTDGAATQEQAADAESTEAQPKETEAAEEDVPQEYKNALKKAESYSKTMYMSKQGIYDQLTSEYGEGFPAEAAQYAVDNLQADYNANALKKAESYYKDMAMSKDAVYEQLISEYGEKFTPEEAQYAIDNLAE